MMRTPICLPARNSMATPGNRRAMLLLILLSGLIISLCMGLRQSLGLFMRPMTLDLGISAATFGFSIALQNIVWGVSQPFVGALADRYGPRPVLIVTALLYAAGLLLMVFSKGIPGGLEVAGFPIGICTAGAGFGVLIGTISRATPPEKRSQTRSEEHTSELQSRPHLVCRLLLEKKKISSTLLSILSVYSLRFRGKFTAREDGIVI